MKMFLIFILTIISINVSAQNDNLPFKELGAYSEEFSPNNIVARMIEGLGYRFYWATESLTDKDLKYKPSEDSRSSLQTLEHIYGLSVFILYTFEGKEYDFSQDEMTFTELRNGTLKNLKIVYDMLNENADISQMQVRLNLNGQSLAFPFWNAINGPISDSLWHTGQIVSFRRASGNPINPKVNVFIGKTME